MKKIFSIALLLATVVTSTAFAATLIVTPNTTTYYIGSNAAISLSWAVSSGGGSAASSAGVFSRDTTTNNFGSTSVPANPMSTTYNTPAINTTVMSPTTNIAEMITIPTGVIADAQANQLSTIYYSRSFNVGTEGYTQLRFVAINLTYQPPTITASPSVINYIIGSGSMVNISWRVTTFGDGNGNAYFDDGAFATAPNASSTIAGGINAGVLTTSLVATGTSTAFDSFTIPKVVLDYAQQNNLTTIYYGRPYYFDYTGYIGGELFVRINLLVANPNAALSLNRVALRFSDNTSIKVTTPNTNVTALADISYMGSGLFDAMWEIAEPVSTMGEPVFVPIQPVRQFLVGGGQLTLQSPVLPTQKTGLHIVQLKICSPTFALGVAAAVGPCRVPAILQYMISPDGDTSAITLPPLRIRTPADNALLTTDTRFEWQAVKGANGYQLELFLPEQSGLKPDATSIAKRAPASGMMVPAKKNSLSLGELSRNKLRPNTTYYWRIIAIGNNGQMLSSSALREIRIP